MTWKTVMIYINIENSEIIEKLEIIRNNYYIVKQTKKTKINEQQNEGIITRTNYCRPNRQLRFEKWCDHINS